MSRGDNTPGVSRLAAAFRKLSESGNSRELVIDFGGIEQNGSLLTNSFPVPIPKSDYQACKGSALKPGDRVLVAWVGADAVVIDVIAPACQAFCREGS